MVGWGNKLLLKGIVNEQKVKWKLGRWKNGQLRCGAQHEICVKMNKRYGNQKKKSGLLGLR